MTEPAKKYKTFKEYYADPEFRERHKAKMYEKKACKACGEQVTRHHMTRHQKSTKCINRSKQFALMHETAPITEDELANMMFKVLRTLINQV